MPNDKFAVVGTNIAEKATMIWNVADRLFDYLCQQYRLYYGGYAERARSNGNESHLGIKI